MRTRIRKLIIAYQKKQAPGKFFTDHYKPLYNEWYKVFGNTTNGRGHMNDPDEMAFKQLAEMFQIPGPKLIKTRKGGRVRQENLGGIHARHEPPGKGVASLDVRSLVNEKIVAILPDVALTDDIGRRIGTASCEQTEAYELKGLNFFPVFNTQYKNVSGENVLGRLIFGEDGGGFYRLGAHEEFSLRGIVQYLPGHYIAHFKVGEQWYTANDSLVYKSKDISPTMKDVKILWYQRDASGLDEHYQNKQLGGLKNPGNFCFFTATLQCLIHNPFFVKLVLKDFIN
jgi:hypothetical protein